MLFVFAIKCEWLGRSIEGAINNSCKNKERERREKRERETRRRKE
jgi:hypothetical protein